MSLRKLPLPTWEASRAKVQVNKKLDPLEQFIFDNEPAGYYANEWRKDLARAISFVILKS